jgi:hypothetical protein
LIMLLTSWCRWRYTMCICYFYWENAVHSLTVMKMQLSKVLFICRKRAVLILSTNFFSIQLN